MGRGAGQSGWCVYLVLCDSGVCSVQRKVYMCEGFEFMSQLREFMSQSQHFLSQSQHCHTYWQTKLGSQKEQQFMLTSASAQLSETRHLRIVLNSELKGRSCHDSLSNRGGCYNSLILNLEINQVLAIIYIKYPLTCRI